MNSPSGYYCMGGQVLNLTVANKDKKRMPLEGLSGYFRVIDGAACGTSLLKAFSAKDKRIFSLLGIPENLEVVRKLYPDGKYTSDYLLERGANTGEFYSVYRCYGNWRIGGLDEFCPHLGELLEHIAPEKHPGWHSLRSERIFERCLEPGVLATDGEVERYWGMVSLRSEPTASKASNVPF